MTAEIRQFPNEVADVLEHYARLARQGEITGVVLAALGPGRLTEDVLSVHSGVNYTERRALITSLEDAALVAMMGAQD
ncbi:hypothetical protein G5B47_02220 [Paenibacillus sp. 7124]|uniref:Uncharacterized protein n=1 Tax=Paenibacillus apii TaxID=1850370 RepID=A0A6M1PGY3_9BACL|nr:hypothetical protein [Paenibacillus apii]NGM81223.1 hypothetical protein [Paenibacillus apii]